MSGRPTRIDITIPDVAYEFWRSGVEDGVKEGLHDVFESLEHGHSLSDRISLTSKRLRNLRSIRRD